MRADWQRRGLPASAEGAEFCSALYIVAAVCQSRETIDLVSEHFLLCGLSGQFRLTAVDTSSWVKTRRGTWLAEERIMCET